MSKRRKVHREDPEYAAMCRRMVKGLGKRLANGDPYDLQEFRALRDELDAAMRTAVQGQHASGFSLSEIGRGLGTSKQAVEKRWFRRSSASGRSLSVSVAGE